MSSILPLKSGYSPKTSHIRKSLLGGRIGPKLDDRHRGVRSVVQADFEGHFAGLRHRRGHADDDPRGFRRGQGERLVQLLPVGPKALDAFVNVVVGVSHRQNVGEFGIEIGIEHLDRFVLKTAERDFKSASVSLSAKVKK